ncbi:MAG: Fic family protein [Methylobacter sp.]|jgi:Fic family protein
MISITPYLRQDKAPGELQDAVVELYRLDAALNSNIPDSLRKPMTYLLRVVNSFYSNKIEGNPTHPAEILHAQEEGEQGNPTDDLLEIKQHIEVQKSLAINDISKEEVCTPDFLRKVHKSFYDDLPQKFLDIKNPDNGEIIHLVPGEFRQRNVKVGSHTPPEHSELKAYLKWFEEMYQPNRTYGTGKILAAAASHHRLMWIHPFLDGNGRVGRLFTDNYMRCTGLGGYGLWSMSRGFGRDTDAYYEALASADMIRQGSNDGRGILSDRGLLKFTEYFIETGLDQVKYFSALLEPKKLNERIEIYFEMRSRGALISAKGKTLPTLKIESRDIYRKLLYSGPQQRSEIQKMLDVSERTARTIITQMANAGLVKADPKHPISLTLSPSSIELLFPYLW